MVAQSRQESDDLSVLSSPDIFSPAVILSLRINNNCDYGISSGTYAWTHALQPVNIIYTYNSIVINSYFLLCVMQLLEKSRPVTKWHLSLYLYVEEQSL